MIITHIEIVTVFTILLFSYPIFVYAVKDHLFEELNFLRATMVFNKGIILQIANALILAIISFILNKTVYANGHGNAMTDIVLGTAMTYIVVGGFFYIPGLIIINIINWMVRLAIKND